MADLVAALVAKTTFASRSVDRWRASRDETARAFGHSLVAHLLKAGVPLEEAHLRRILGDIERGIHGSPNRARYAMNNALIAIGTWRLPDEAIAAARRIGKVEVDHGDTACKTPDAVVYITKARARRAKPKARGKTGAAARRGAK